MRSPATQAASGRSLAGARSLARITWSGVVLVELHIESLGVIERATLELGAGLTALTGETGAGKTMLVEAIELLVGGRADNSIVRAGADEARVEGRFVTGDDEFVLTRIIPAEGRSRAYVNGRPATVSSLVDMTAGVIELHGQQAHQALLSASAQRSLLDRAASVDLAPLRSAQAALTAVDAELAVLGGDERTRAREIDLLRFQVAELEAAGARRRRRCRRGRCPGGRGGAAVGFAGQPGGSGRRLPGDQR